MGVGRWLAGAALCCIAWQASAAAPSRLHGTIVAVTGDAIEVQPDGGTGHTSIGVSAALKVTLVTPATLGDVRQGDFIGAAAQEGADGTTVATEVHIFADSMRGTGEGHRPFDRGPASTMTNGTVGQEVVGTAGRTLTVRYKGGESSIVVPPTTPVMRLAPGDRAALAPGSHVIVFAQADAAGALTAANVLVGKDGFAPPM